MLEFCEKSLGQYSPRKWDSPHWGLLSVKSRWARRFYSNVQLLRSWAIKVFKDKGPWTATSIILKSIHIRKLERNNAVPEDYVNVAVETYSICEHCNTLHGAAFKDDLQVSVSVKCCGLGSYRSWYWAHITSVLRALYWLSISFWVWFKVLGLIYGLMPSFYRTVFSSGIVMTILGQTSASYIKNNTVNIQMP